MAILQSNGESSRGLMIGMIKSNVAEDSNVLDSNYGRRFGIGKMMAKGIKIFLTIRLSACGNLNQEADSKNPYPILACHQHRSSFALINAHETKKR